MNPDEIISRIGNSTEIIEFATTPARAFCLIGHLQLALRHPGNTGASTEVARQIIDHLAEAISTVTETPEVKTIVEAGYNPTFDVEQS